MAFFLTTKCICAVTWGRISTLDKRITFLVFHPAHKKKTAFTDAAVSINGCENNNGETGKKRELKSTTTMAKPKSAISSLNDVHHVLFLSPRQFLPVAKWIYFNVMKWKLERKMIAIHSLPSRFRSPVRNTLTHKKQSDGIAILFIFTAFGFFLFFCFFFFFLFSLTRPSIRVELIQLRPFRW